MQWNSVYEWDARPFHFLDMFAGCSNVSREWTVPQSVMVASRRVPICHACECPKCSQQVPRKHNSFNAARFDLDFGKAAGRQQVFIGVP